MLPRINTSQRLSLPPDRAILLICMGISLVFWLLVKLSDRYTTQKQVDLEVELPDDLAFSGGSPPPLTVDVEGTGWDLLFSYFGAADSLAYNLRTESDPQLSATRLQNDISAHFASEDLVVQGLEDADLNLNLEPTMARRVPIRLRDSLRFAPGYKLVRPIRLDPDSVTVRGPRSALEELEAWPTQPLVLTDVKTTQQRTLALQRPPSGVQLDPEEVVADMEVEQLTEKSLFVPLHVRHAPPNDSLRFFPQRVKLRCIVGLSQYASVDSADFELVADLQNLPIDEGQNTVPIQLVERPSFVRNVTYSPATAKFYIVKRDSLPPDE